MNKPDARSAAQRAIPAGTGSLRFAVLLLTIAALGCLLAGCVTTGNLAPRETAPTNAQVAAQFHLATADAGGSSGVSADWWRSFHDEQLDHWVELGLADNPDLRQALARVAGAQAMFAAARAAQSPTVAFAADIDQQRISTNGIYPPPLAGLTGTIDDIGFSASYDFDLFGRLSARTEAARLGTLAGEADRQLARIHLAGAIGRAYFDLAHAQETHRVLVELARTRTELLDLVRERVRAGFDTQVDRRLAEVPVPQIRADIERADEQITLAHHRLALLAGQPPEAAAAVEAKFPDAAALAPPAALPLDLLGRRADIVAARLRVQSAARSIDEAKAEFYPNVNLTALIGLDALSLQHLFKWPSRVWQLEPAVHLPLFYGGLLRANLASADAQSDEAVSAYNATVLQAVGEVSDALASIASVQRQREQQRLATESAQAAADLAQIRYGAGLGNILAVLTAQTSVLAQRRAEIDLAARSAELDVMLAVALGGGYGGSAATTQALAQ